MSRKLNLDNTYFKGAGELIPLWVGQFWQKFTSDLFSFDKLGCPFSCGQENLLGGQFWAMGRLNLLGGQSNLLGGQMPTQFTCYLPP